MQAKLNAIEDRPSVPLFVARGAPNMIFLKQKSGQQKKTRYPFLKSYLRQAVMQMMKLPGKKNEGRPRCSPEA